MKIPQEIIEKSLLLYKPETRVLTSAQIEYPTISGRFKLPPTFYTNFPLQHLADIEIQLCLNQLAYTGLNYAISQKLIPELAELNFSELQNEGCLIIESRKKFRKAIKTDSEIEGKISIEKIRDFDRLIMGTAGFDFENRSCIGELELVLVKPK